MFQLLSLGILVFGRSVAASSPSQGSEDFTSVINLKSESGYSDVVTLESRAKISTFRSAFLEWADAFDKEYKTMEEEVERMLVWIDNHEFIESHNNNEPAHSFTLGHNSFSDITPEEFRLLHNLGEFSPGTEVILEQQKKAEAKAKIGNLDEDQQKIIAEHRRLVTTSKKNIPKHVDWVKEGAVTPVKDQGPCGSCWAFSAIGALEGAKFIKDGELVALSEQNLMDCDKFDKACMGGLMDSAFKFDESTKGLCSEDDYPYIAKQHAQCMKNCTVVPDSKVKSYIDIEPGDNDGLLASLAMQPTCVAIQADQLFFQFYKSGVLNAVTCGASGNVDHGVLAVGFGTDPVSGLDFYRIKNSWGDKWGEHGYIRMVRDLTNEFGMCSILRIMTFPILA